MRVKIEHMHDLVPIKCDEIDIIKLFNMKATNAYTNGDATVYFDPDNNVIIELTDSRLYTDDYHMYKNNGTVICVYYNVEMDNKVMKLNMLKLVGNGVDHVEIIKSINSIDVPDSNGVLIHEEQYDDYTIMRYDTKNN